MAARLSTVRIPADYNAECSPIEQVEGALVIQPRVFSDGRGFFQEVYNFDKFPLFLDQHNGNAQWRRAEMKQVSVSSSRANTIRGIHCAPYAKLVQCTAGRVFDVVVDLRKTSPTFGRWYGTWLSAKNHTQMYIPARCGHGFFAAEDNSTVVYSQEGTYAPGQDVELNPMDVEVGIQWPQPVICDPDNQEHSDRGVGDLNGYIVSQKDRDAASLLALQPRLQKICEQELMANASSPAAADKSVSSGVDYVILGASGFLGSATVQELRRRGRVVAISNARLEDFPAICADLDKFAPIRCGVICCAGTAGKPNIGWCESHEPETIQLNVVGQLNVAEACRQHLRPDGRPTHCTIIGTGCIYAYDEEAGHPMGGPSATAYDEADVPNFVQNVYARLRISLEQLLRPFPNVLLLRVSYPIDCANMHPRSLAAKLLRYSTITSVPTSVTVMDDLWPRIPRLVESDATGVVNFNNAGTITNERILQLYHDLVDSNIKWVVDENIPDEGTKAFSHLSCARLSKLDPLHPVLTAEDAVARGFRTRAQRLTKHAAKVASNEEA